MLLKRKQYLRILLIILTLFGLLVVILIDRRIREQHQAPVMSQESGFYSEEFYLDLEFNTEKLK